MTTKTAYILSYNAVSFLLWCYITFQVLYYGPTFYAESRLQTLYSALLSPLLTGTQSLAVLEVLHAALGIVRASPLTTAIQVGGKNLVVWTVMVRFPDILVSNDGIWGFLGCVLAWGFSEMIRYGFFVVQLTTRDAPGWLKWLRYSAFVVLYPPGFLSEAWLVYISLQRTIGISSIYRGYLLIGLLSYFPLGYILYSHMLSQRRRVLRKQSV